MCGREEDEYVCPVIPVRAEYEVEEVTDPINKFINKNTKYCCQWKSKKK